MIYNEILWPIIVALSIEELAIAGKTIYSIDFGVYGRFDFNHYRLVMPIL